MSAISLLILALFLIAWLIYAVQFITDEVRFRRGVGAEAPTVNAVRLDTELQHLLASSEQRATLTPPHPANRFSLVRRLEVAERAVAGD